MTPFTFIPTSVSDQLHPRRLVIPAEDRGSDRGPVLRGPRPLVELRAAFGAAGRGRRSDGGCNRITGTQTGRANNNQGRQP